MAMRQLIVVLLMITSAAYPQAANSTFSSTPDSERGWTFNFRRTPLEISTDSERSYALENKAKVPVKRFRLGCVRTLPNKTPLIVRRMVVKNAKIAPGESWFSLGSHQNPDRIACEHSNGRLAAIEVDFEDGTQWRAVAKVEAH